jgi:hypothetical protein
MENTYITSVIKQFNYYKTVGDKTFEQLTFEDLIWQPNDASNSISIIVKHMVGNMFSRWTNFLTEDGEKIWRQRDQEFEDSYKNKEEIITAWENGWNCLFEAISPLTDKDMTKIIYIRNEGHLVSEAIFRQLGHYPYHIGQIAYIGKLLKDNEWQSLSIPKDQSTSYNKDKFSQEKGRRHFTDNL